MNIEVETMKAISDGVMSSSLLKSLNLTWLIIAGIGLPMLGMVVYRYVIKSIADRLILFFGNKQWTDPGKLVEFKGERYIIKKLGLFRVYLEKGVKVKNRGKVEVMRKVLTFPIPSYLEADIIYYEYANLYNEEELGQHHNGEENGEQ
jgi:hypothetical protein